MNQTLTIEKFASDSLSFSFYVPNADVIYVDFMVQNNPKDYDLFIESNSKKELLPFQPGQALGVPLNVYGTSNNLLFIQDEYVNGLVHNKHSKTTSFHAVNNNGNEIILQYNLKEFFYNTCRCFYYTNRIIKIELKS